MDAVLAFHNAFRRDMAGIDAAALSWARGRPEATAALERFRFLNEMLVWHADGEELAIFPALERVAPLVAEAYIQDHRGLDAAFDALNDAVAAKDALQTARATAAFKFHLDMHLAKEDAHVYRLIRERVSLQEQGAALGLMSGAVPQERFAEVVGWLFPLIEADDRENTVRIWQTALPPVVFGGIVQLIQRAIGDDWADLNRRVPEIAG
jgi:hemerythrin-like domain-containing protein